MDYFEDKVSPLEVTKIFNSNIDRELFISEYQHLQGDENLDFYKNFIDQNIHSYRFRLQEDAIDLSINLDYFKVSFFKSIKEIIHSRRNNWIKLACLDWLFNFSQLINKADYLEINRYALKKSTDELLQVQCILNLLLIEIQTDVIENLLNVLQTATLPATFYRFINGFEKLNIDKEINQRLIISVISLVKSNKLVSESQKNELINSLSSMTA